MIMMMLIIVLVLVEEVVFGGRRGGGGVVVCWLLDVPVTGECISGTGLLNFTCCHTEMEAADQTFHLTQSQYIDTGPTSPSTDLITSGAWQGSNWRANF